MPTEPAFGPGQTSIRLTIPANANAVREGLRTLVTRPPLALLAEDLRDAAELALAEVLNNIVEHGHADHSGDILLELRTEATDLFCQVHDTGHPFPEGSPPTGGFPDLTKDLPEGGFGWALIRSLARDIRYERRQGQNRTSFRICRDPCEINGNSDP